MPYRFAYPHLREICLQSVPRPIDCLPMLGTFHRNLLEAFIKVAVKHQRRAENLRHLNGTSYQHAATERICFRRCSFATLGNTSLVYETFVNISYVHYRKHRKQNTLPDTPHRARWHAIWKVPRSFAKATGREVPDTLNALERARGPSVPSDVCIRTPMSC